MDHPEQTTVVPLIHLVRPVRAPSRTQRWATARRGDARLHITAFISLFPGGPSFNPTEVLGRTYFFAILAIFCGYSCFCLTFAPLADVAFGIKGAKSALRLCVRFPLRFVFCQMEALFLILICSTALILGNEFSIAAFIHPGLSRANHRSFLPAIQVFAKLLGKVMPFWMGGTLLVHLIVLWLTWHWPAPGSVWLLLATILWIAIILLSVLGPVPINDRVKGWDVNKLPADWEDQRRTWDRLNAIRVAMIFVAFLALLLSFKDLV
jgi:uncharacterized membrane protein